MFLRLSSEGAPVIISPDYSQPSQLTSLAEDAGLDHQRVFDIAFETNGVAWLATDNGLHRYDGFNWRHFGTNDGLPSAFVRAVMVSREGQLWVGTDKGAGVFDASKSKFETKGSESGLPNLNIREIDQDPDGTIWFSCDQWPDLHIPPGGLSCLKDGKWQTFTRTNGLPMDYVIGYFRDSSGRQFVMTPSGWGQRSGQHWGPPVNPGYELLNQVLQMAEGDDGLLVAHGETTMLVLSNGVWQTLPSELSRLLCRTRAGELLATVYDREIGQLWFSRWKGDGFRKFSAVLDVKTDSRLYHMREAPDGSLWAIGIGVVARLAYGDKQWEFYPSLPPTVGCDSRGRVWFARNTNLVVSVSNRFLKLPPEKLFCWNEHGTALVRNEQDQTLAVTDPSDPLLLRPLEAKFFNVDIVEPDDMDGFWVVGRLQTNMLQLVHYHHGRTVKIDATPFQNRRVLSATSAAPGQLWVWAQNLEDSRNELILVTDEKVERQPLNPGPPPIAYGDWHDGAGRHWLSGYAGIYEQVNPPTGNWQQVTSTVREGFGVTLMGSKEALFVFSGGRAGESGVTLFSSNGWKTVYGDFSNPTYAGDKQTIFMGSRHGLIIRKEPGTLNFEHLRTPDGSRVHLAVEDQNGDIWLGTSERVLRYRPGHIPPQPGIVANATEVMPGRPLPVVFSSRNRFELEADCRDFYYSWRLDNLPWSPFAPWQQTPLSLPSLAAGQHYLEVRSRDVDGNVSDVPARLQFSILPVPLQQRVWFVPAVLSLAALLSWLVWLGIARTQQIAATNAALRRENDIRRGAEAELEQSRRELEQRVVERTAELTRANQSLNHEIAERKQAEETQRRLEEQLRQSQKMEAIGTLAGGIAHDFNNLLAVIIPYCHLTLDEVSDRPDLKFQLEEVLKAADRGKNLVQQILTFSRRQRQERRVVDLQPTVKETLKLLRSALPSTIQIDQRINSTPPVLADPTQIHQVIMNLCVNAQHAMDGRQGRLEIGLDDVRVDEALCARSADLRPGHYVRLSVRDTGCGMSPEILNRIFEPFFTTKETGHGTGLGLSVVHGIVQNHDGAILVQSRPGEGTAFEVFLPAQTGAVDNIAEPPRPAPCAKGEHVLIVDDEPGITRSLKLVLTRNGYRVTTYNDPQTAFRYFASRPADTELILTDLTMPGMTGLEFARKVFAIRPDLPVVLATGFGGDQVSPEQLANQPNIRKVLDKPLDPHNVIQTVAEILMSKRPT
jgi:signal transduction histidine kinase